MRILMLIDQIGDGVGGGERMAIGLASALAGRGEDVTLCVTRGSKPADRQALEGTGLRVLDLERRSALDLAAFRPMLKLISEQRIEVLHAHKFGSNVWGMLFGLFARVPALVAQEQTWSYEGQPLRKLLDGVIGRVASSFVCACRRPTRARIQRWRERVPPRRSS